MAKAKDEKKSAQAPPRRRKGKGKKKGRRLSSEEDEEDSQEEEEEEDEAETDSPLARSATKFSEGVQRDAEEFVRRIRARALKEMDRVRGDEEARKDVEESVKVLDSLPKVIKLKLRCGNYFLNVFFLFSPSAVASRSATPPVCAAPSPPWTRRMRRG